MLWNEGMYPVQQPQYWAPRLLNVYIDPATLLTTAYVYYTYFQAIVCRDTYGVYMHDYPW